MLKDESEVQMLLQMLETWVPNLWEDMNEFFKRITEKNEEERTILQKYYYDPIKKQKLVIFGSNQKKKVTEHN